VPPSGGYFYFAQLRVYKWFGLRDDRNAEQDVLRVHFQGECSAAAATAKYGAGIFVKGRFAGGIGYVHHVRVVLVAIQDLICARQACRPEQEQGKEYGHEFHLYKYKPF
jgi:hypothetical protein